MTSRAIDESVAHCGETTYRLRTGRLLRTEYRAFGDALDDAAEKLDESKAARAEAKDAGQPLPARFEYDTHVCEIVLDAIAKDGIGRAFSVEDAESKTIAELKIADATRAEIDAWVDAWVPDAVLISLGFAMRAHRVGNGVALGEFKGSSPQSPSRTSDAETATTA